MREARVQGIVLSVMPLGEYDRRVEILTMERGKISAFARGVRRQAGPLGAACRSFATGEFVLYEGRSSYTLKEARIQNYFEAVSGDMEAVSYGSYFLELASYYGREGSDERQSVELLYCALTALTRESLPHELVRTVFEEKLLMMNGDFSGIPSGISAPADYALKFILNTPPGKLFSFLLSEEVFQEVGAFVAAEKARYLKREFSSLRVLEELRELLGMKNREKTPEE